MIKQYCYCDISHTDQEIANCPNIADSKRPERENAPVSKVDVLPELKLGSIKYKQERKFSLERFRMLTDQTPKIEKITTMEI